MQLAFLINPVNFSISVNIPKNKIDRACYFPKFKCQATVAL